MEDKTARELIRALDRNTKATEALHALHLVIERNRIQEKRDEAEEAQLAVKRAVKNSGLNAGFCFHCSDIKCVPDDGISNWTATGCRCCRLNHNLIQGK